MILSDLHSRVGRLGLTCAIIGLLLVLLSSGCAQATPTPEPVTIRFAYPRDLSPNQAYNQELARRFNESYPHITVELSPKSWQELGSLISGEGDIATVDVFVTQASALSGQVERGDILSLDPWIAQDESFDLAGFYPGTLELYQREGQTWGIPAGVNPRVMYYNRDLFDQYDVPTPEIGWTWDEFLQRALAIRDPEASVFGYAVLYRYDDAMWFIYQHGGGIFNDWQNLTRTTFSDPLTVEALEWFAKLIHEYHVAPTPVEATRAFGGYPEIAIVRGIVQGKIGMWMGPVSDRGGQWWWQPWSMRWGIAPLPRGARSATFVVDYGHAISSQTQHSDACWRWIAFLSYHISNHSIPTRKSVAESSVYEELVGKEVAAAARAAMEESLLYPARDADDRFGEALQSFCEAVDQIIEGDATPQEAMDWAQQQCEK